MERDRLIIAESVRKWRTFVLVNREFGSESERVGE